MNPSTVEFTPLRISTNTATGNIGGPLKLDVLFEQLPLVLIPFGYPEEGILKMEHKDKRVGASQKDMLTKKKRLPKKPSSINLHWLYANAEKMIQASLKK